MPIYAHLLQRNGSRCPLLLQAGLWMAVLTLAVAIASLTPEMAFMFAISPTSPFSRVCDSNDLVRIPLDVPRELVCLPAYLFQQSTIDLVVPPVFAALVVAGSACVVRAVGF
ncbi:hypothetical protein Dimus_029903 [Dionaea muscipula]